MQLENKSVPPLVACCGVPTPAATNAVEEQLADFLDGKTHGEELLHALYDHILDEPVPEQMRALFRAGSAD